MAAALSLIVVLPPCYGAAGQTPEPPALPLDSVEVVRVLREAAAAFAESSDSMRANGRFREHLRALLAAWGTEADLPSVPDRPIPERSIDSLVARGEVSEALVRMRG